MREERFAVSIVIHNNDIVGVVACASRSNNSSSRRHYLLLRLLRTSSAPLVDLTRPLPPPADAGRNPPWQRLGPRLSFYFRPQRKNTPVLLPFCPPTLSRSRLIEHTSCWSLARIMKAEPRFVKPPDAREGLLRRFLDPE